ncbi:hypothetical protein DFQ26_000785, partial [Actinomortierella ambigua]
DTIDDLKKLIKAEIPDTFNGIDAKDLSLWRVSILVPPKKNRKEIWLADVPSKEELDKTDDIADEFDEALPKKTIHIIVQRPPPQGDLHADTNATMDKSFAPESKITNFLDATSHCNRRTYSQPTWSTASQLEKSSKDTIQPAVL